MSAAITFALAKLRALWHEGQGHTVQSFTASSGRVHSIYCNECGTFLWVRP